MTTGVTTAGGAATDAATTGPDGAPIPRTIWLMWWQGLEQAPALVKHCYRSWQQHNPGWNVVFLDETNHKDYVDIDNILASGSDLRLQAKADMIRIQLLARHGGVWVDATCYCCGPLGEWLPEHAETGFFAFPKPANNRLLDSWFLASTPDHPLTTGLWEVTENYWLNNRGLALRPSQTFFDRLLRTLLNSSVWATQFWLSYPVGRWLKAYPYRWPVFLFARLLRRDPRSAALWRGVKKVSADVPHRLLRVGPESPLGEARSSRPRSTPAEAPSVSSSGATTRRSAAGPTTRARCCSMCSRNRSSREMFGPVTRCLA